MPELDRRDFLKLVGASAGAAAATGCSDPVENLIPYVIQPEEILPGESNYYASTCTECPVNCGLHVTTREGRPIKLEGNPDHPINQGTLCIRGQAGIGRTYHPDRYQSPMKKVANGLVMTEWDEAIPTLAAKIKAAGKGTRILGGPVGPTLSRLIDEWVVKVGAGGRTIYDPFAREALRAGAGMVFGRAVTPTFNLTDADLVLDFSSDFLDQGPSPVEMARQFADAKDLAKHPEGGAELISFGPRLSMTASKADRWIPSNPGGEGALALALAAEVFKKNGAGSLTGSGDGIRNLLSGINASQLAASAGVDGAAFSSLVKRVLAAHSAVALAPGASASSTSAVSSNASVLLLNGLLGGIGKHVSVPAIDTAELGASMDEIKSLIAEMNAGKVKVLLIHDSNPVYSLPARAGFAEALGKVDTVVSFASMKDETSEIADLVLPDNSALESWGDANPRPGIRSLIQPTIRPLFATRQLGDSLIALAQGAAAGLGVESFIARLKETWATTNWRESLARGGVFSEVPSSAVRISPQVSRIKVERPALSGAGDFTLVAFPHSFIGDGRGAAQPWLQEIPDPIARASWLSWLELNDKVAKKLGFEYGEVVEVTTGQGAGSIKLPVYPRGAIQEDVIAIAIGQGHTVGHFGSLAGDGRPGVARGVSVTSVLDSAVDEQGGRTWLNVKASVKATGEYQRIPLTQWTDNQRGRGLAPTVSLLDIAAGKGELDHGDAKAAGGHDAGGSTEHAGAESHEGGGDHSEFILPYDPANDASPDSPYRWAMTIDNDKCTGCAACVAACYTENNIPIVGEETTALHRELSWIRIERYVDEGDRSDGAQRRSYPDREELGKTDVRYTPMLCQQCGAAPCEAVCPVIATYHSPDGLNGMIFNRCVGTRYCANNCVYKVRRFNYSDYSRENWPGIMNLMLNPNVTARQQGVMEKCSFCVQRIAAARQTAKDEGRDIADGEVVTACQQTCPSDAIQFGNAKDDKSTVVKTADDDKRAYHSLHELNTRPAITYLSKVDRADDERSHG